jgi:hypothetical protein
MRMTCAQFDVLTAYFVRSALRREHTACILQVHSGTSASFKQRITKLYPPVRDIYGLLFV